MFHILKHVETNIDYCRMLKLYSFYSSADFNFSAFSATIRESMQPCMSPSMKAGRL